MLFTLIYIYSSPAILLFYPHPYASKRERTKGHEVALNLD